MALAMSYQNQMNMHNMNMQYMNNGNGMDNGDSKPPAHVPPRKRRRELPQALQDLVKPDFHQVNLAVERDIKDVIGVKLDKDEQICRLNLTPAGCPLGPLHCPLRHTMPSKLNFAPPNPRDQQRLQTVCKHWLRGLCKKGESCEFLHEYNLRRMPECWWYAKYGYCSAGDECLYTHPKEHKIECPDYARGFCPLGSKCERKHSRRVACQLYLSGFCPHGPECQLAHPKWTLPTKSDYEPAEQNQRELGPPPPGYGRYADHPGGPGGGAFTNNPGGRGGGGYGGGPAGEGGPGAGRGGGFERRNLDEVTCFKCGERGHYANMCRNRNVPGNRGGQERGPGGRGGDLEGSV